MDAINEYLKMCGQQYQEKLNLLKAGLAYNTPVPPLGDLINPDLFRYEQLAYLARYARKAIERGDLAEWLESLHKRALSQARYPIYNSTDGIANIIKEAELNAMTEFYLIMIELLESTENIIDKMTQID